ncbi:MAG: phenylalanine--tRNA ligase subunit alpha [Alphaproteobacteria bacterium]|nr:phenylalanine--tRNA ligase subunit alpha [Alphaproteobacteria bacterium]
MTDLAALETELSARIAAAANLEALEALRVETLGKKGRVTELMKTLGTIAPEERKARGAAFNVLKDAIAAKLDARKVALEGAALDARLAQETVDVTLPPRAREEGRIHPISQTIDELVAIFGEMGFAVAEGPDIESDDYNFTRLNIPPEHPARQAHDTFYLAGKPGESHVVLRTHTSPVQVRTMLGQKPPIRIIAPGRTYRSDSDATHSPNFHQIEGLIVDKSTHMGHLKGCLVDFVRAFFEMGAEASLKTDYRMSCPAGTVTLDLDPESEALREPCQDVFASLVDAVEEALAPIPKAKRRDLAGLIVSTMQGAYIRARAARDVSPFREAGENLAALAKMLTPSPRNSAPRKGK